MLNFFAEISRNARAYPHSLALISRTGTVDYRTLVQFIENIGAHAVCHGLATGQTVHVETDDDDLRLLMFLGLMRAGLTVALMRSAGVAFLGNDVVPDIVITEKSEKSALAQRAGRVVRFSRDWLHFAPPDRTALPDDPDFALIYVSSGSTGQQKLIKESRQNIEYAVDRRLKELMFQSYIRYLPSVGETSHGTFPHYIVTLFNCGSIVRLPQYAPDDIVSATAFLQPTYVKLPPVTLAEVLKLLDAAPRKFQKVGYLRISGAYCSTAVRAAALEEYAERLVIGYGSTEIDQIAGGEFADIGENEGSVGWIRDGMIVETLDDNGYPLPQGGTGEIRVKPPAEMVTRYVTRNGLTNVLRDGWFYPGDIGRVDASGQLIITGRKSTVINLGGNKINPEVAEADLQECDGVEDVAVAPVVGEHGFQTICALVVTKAPISLDDINRFLVKRGARFGVKQLKIVSEIPRNSNRKIDRPAVQTIAGTV